MKIIFHIFYFIYRTILLTNVSILTFKYSMVSYSLLPIIFYFFCTNRKNKGSALMFLLSHEIARKMLMNNLMSLVSGLPAVKETIVISGT